jgi:hypothetical protein
MWEHELYDEFQFHQDRTFFHSFPSDVGLFFWLCSLFLASYSGAHSLSVFFLSTRIA